MRYFRLTLLGVAIPLLLTATVFAVPGRGGLFSMQMDNNDATNLQKNNQAWSNSLVATAEATPLNTHDISMTAMRLPSGLLAYKMVQHTITNAGGTVDVTTRYSSSASIPGPTIVITEGDQVNLTIQNSITGMPGDLNKLVGVHVHGVHYEITSDATLEHINHIGDQGSYPVSGAGPDSFTYHWVAGLGTAGSWPYHDHTWGGINGAENKGLYGMVIVNPASGIVQATDGKTITNVTLSSDVKKDFVLYLGDDAFWGMEINRTTGQQTPLWVNPTLVAKQGDYVRFNLIALGTDMHSFKLSNIRWLDPGTNTLISTEEIGPLENHVFTIKADKKMTQYIDLQDSNNLMGMKGSIKVTNSGGNSIPGPLA